MTLASGTTYRDQARALPERAITEISPCAIKYFLQLHRVRQQDAQNNKILRDQKHEYTQKI